MTLKSKSLDAGNLAKTAERKAANESHRLYFDREEFKKLEARAIETGYHIKGITNVHRAIEAMMVDHLLTLNG